ncbi:MAG: indolepyruvate oxidoreductase subunit beta [Bacillota bacterium]
MTKSVNIMLAGVGGQGVLLASEVISKVAMEKGYDVKKSEVHGMAQRGGSVVSNVRFGEKIYSPIIAEGEADILLAFEKLEALRWLNYLKEDGIIITNTQKIDPLPVANGREKYPEKVMDKLEKSGHKVISLDALSKAREAGTQKAINTVLLGALANEIDISKDLFEKVIKENVPESTIEINTTAFKAGFEATN